MPTESKTAEIVATLRAFAASFYRCFGPSNGEHDTLVSAADLLEANAREIERLEKERDEARDYSIDLQRIIESLCGGREIVVPQTGARHHYNMAVTALARASALEAERDKLRDGMQLIRAQLPWIEPNSPWAAGYDWHANAEDIAHDAARTEDWVIARQIDALLTPTASGAEQGGEDGAH